MKNCKKVIAVLLVAIFVFSGCFMLPVEPEVMIPPIVSIPEVTSFDTTPVLRGDVESVFNPTAFMVVGVQIPLQFAVAGFPILDIYVSAGDEVREGDLLASLNFEDSDSVLPVLVTNRDNLRINLTQATERLNLIRRLEQESGVPLNSATYAASVRQIQRELNITNFVIDNIGGDIEATRSIFSPMDGFVVSVMPWGEHTISDTSSSVITLSEHSRLIFEIRDSDAVSIMNIGDKYEILAAGELFLTEMVHPAVIGFQDRPNVNERAFLVVVGEDPDIARGVRGEVQNFLAGVKDVVYVDIKHINKVDDRYFVYVYENGTRTMRDVVPGLFGNERVEILEGLSEGELIVV